ncbi:MAG: hypothetical protein JWP29_3535 [Rhodoferax sp.]|nr:hypothetical protein [Rhodoferax sp.]
MADYGVQPTGFVKMRLDEVRAAIVSDLTTRLGRQVQTRPDSIIGQLIDTFAEREATLWEMAEAVYGSMYPPTAFGMSLDNAVSFAGVTRLGDAATQVFVVLYGVDGTAIPAGSLIGLADSSVQLALTTATTISASAVVDVSVIVPAVTPNTAYAVTLGGSAYTYTSGSTTSLSTVINGLATALLTSGLNISSDGASIRIQTDGRASVSVSVSSNLKIGSLGSPGIFAATEPGPFAVPVNGLGQMVTRITGWSSIDNLQPGLPGRYRENDAELRARYNSGVYLLGAAVLPSIRAGLESEVQGVTKALVLENTTNVTDADGRVPHSVQAVVEGGDDQAIAEKLFTLVAAGIDYNGSVVMTVIDTQGASHPIKFSRPSKVYIWAKCVITTLAEETLPGNALATIAGVIADTGNALDIGSDVVVQRFYGPIYVAVPGIGSLAITFASSSNPAFSPASGDYTAGNVTIPATGRAVFDPSRISVT